MLLLLLGLISWPSGTLFVCHSRHFRALKVFNGTLATPLSGSKILTYLCLELLFNRLHL